jgi:hypothetical protein
MACIASRVARLPRLWVIRTKIVERHPAADAGQIGAAPLALGQFIPVLGYLDEVVILPLGIVLAVRLVPPDLMAEFRQEADRLTERPASRAGAAMIIVLWLLAAAALLLAFWPRSTV